MSKGVPRRKIGRSLEPETARLRYAGKDVRAARPSPIGLLRTVLRGQVVDDFRRLGVGDPANLLRPHLLDEVRPLLLRLLAGHWPVKGMADAAIHLEEGLSVRYGNRLGRRGGRGLGGFLL